jgi:hypothetical protein
MDDPQKGAAALAVLGQNARNSGREIARMLAASSFSSEEKKAWANLVPYMDLALLKRFTSLLAADLEGTVAEQAEDTMLLLKAAAMKREFAVSHAKKDAADGIRALEQELVTLERAHA